MFNEKILQLTSSRKRQNFDFSDTYIWHGGMMKNDEIKNCENNPTFTLSMEFIDIHDHKGEIVNIDDHEQMNNNHLMFTTVSKKYEWKLENFKADNCEYTTNFRSGAFNIDGFDFMMHFYIKPKLSSTGQDKGILQLHLLRLPWDISSMSVVYVLRLQETDAKCWWIDGLDHNRNNNLGLLEWDDDCLLLSEIQNINTLTFSCDVQIIDVYDKKGNCIVYNDDEKEEEKDIEQLVLPEPQYFEWRILPKSQIASLSTATVITSEIFILFGIKWYLMLIPKYSKWSNVLRIYIGIADLPLNVSEIAIYCKFKTKERNE